ncbi:MAG: metal ABC transporter ATP-binding protein [Planctomycetota bacterium]|nr:metal ABC transporter ATP-binding protein [Planctomycetota bacterium]
MTTAAIEFERVTHAYPGQSAPALKNISLRVEEGERLGVLGPNGGGKSTLLKIALGVLGGYEGTVKVFGMAPSQARRRGLIGYVAQRSEANLAFPITARQGVAMGAGRGAGLLSGLGAERRARVERALELTGADAFADRAVGSLSGGQLQRVWISRALAAGPRILALDEPTVGIDVEGQRRFADLLTALHAELGLTILIVSHDIRAVAAGCDRVACLARTLHFHAAPKGLTPEVLAEVFSHDVAAMFGDVHVHAHPAEACPLDHDHGHAHGHAPAGGEGGDRGSA